MMNTPMVQVGQPMHSGMQSQQGPPPQQTQLQPQLELKFDNLNKVKSLIRSLNESFGNVMGVAGARVNHMASGKTDEDVPPRLDRTLEEYLSICNEIELLVINLKEIVQQHKDSLQHLPIQVTLGKQDTASGPLPDGSLNYPQLVTTAKAQINYVKSIQDILVEITRKVKEPLLPGPLLDFINHLLQSAVYK